MAEPTNKVRVRVLSLPPRQSTSRRVYRLALLVLVVGAAAAAVVLVRRFVPVSRWLTAAQLWLEHHLTLGLLLLPLLLALTLPLFVPTTVLELAAGSLFGFARGFALALVGKTIGGLLAFALGRLAFTRGGARAKLVEKSVAFRAVCDVVERGGWRPLMLLQLSGLPGALKCYALALTALSPVRFAVSLVAGGLPQALVWAYLGSNARSLLGNDDHNGNYHGDEDEEGERKDKAATRTRLGVVIGSVVVTVAAMAVLSIAARRRLREYHRAIAPEATEESTEEKQPDHQTAEDE